MLEFFCATSMSKYLQNEDPFGSVDSVPDRVGRQYSSSLWDLLWDAISLRILLSATSIDDAESIVFLYIESSSVAATK